VVGNLMICRVGRGRQASMDDASSDWSGGSAASRIRYVLRRPPGEEGGRGGLLVASAVGSRDGWASRATRGGMVSSPGIGGEFKEFPRTRCDLLGFIGCAKIVEVNPFF
jgi:hypothetical protein